MHEEVDRLWELLPHPPGTVIRWFAQNRERTHRVGDFAMGAGELKRVISSLPNMNIYVAPNPCNKLTGTRHSTKDVTHWSWLFLDMDPIEGKETVAEPDLALKLAIKKLEDMVVYKLNPLILYSGRGAQAWIRLDDWPLDDSNRFKIQRAMGYWLDQLDKELGTNYDSNLDTSCRDLPRIMRCVGSTNQRTLLKAHLIQDGMSHPGLGVRLLDWTPKEIFDQPDVIQLHEGTPWELAVTHLTYKAKRFIRNGWEEPGRHDAMWHTAKCLQERGISREQAELALRYGNDMCLPSPLSDRDIRHALDTAYGIVYNAHTQETNPLTKE